MYIQANTVVEFCKILDDWVITIPEKARKNIVCWVYGYDLNDSCDYFTIIYGVTSVSGKEIEIRIPKKECPFTHHLAVHSVVYDFFNMILGETILAFNKLPKSSKRESVVKKIEDTWKPDDPYRFLDLE